MKACVAKEKKKSKLKTNPFYEGLFRTPSTDNNYFLACIGSSFLQFYYLSCWQGFFFYYILGCVNIIPCCFKIRMYSHLIHFKQGKSF